MEVIVHATWIIKDGDDTNFDGLEKQSRNEIYEYVKHFTPDNIEVVIGEVKKS